MVNYLKPFNQRRQQVWNFIHQEPDATPIAVINYHNECWHDAMEAERDAYRTLLHTVVSLLIDRCKIVMEGMAWCDIAQHLLENDAPPEASLTKARELLYYYWQQHIRKRIIAAIYTAVVDDLLLDGYHITHDRPSHDHTNRASLLHELGIHISLDFSALDAKAQPELEKLDQMLDQIRCDIRFPASVSQNGKNFDLQNHQQIYATNGKSLEAYLHYIGTGLEFHLPDRDEILDNLILLDKLRDRFMAKKQLYPEARWESDGASLITIEKQHHPLYTEGSFRDLLPASTVSTPLTSIMAAEQANASFIPPVPWWKRLLPFLQ